MPIYMDVHIVPGVKARDVAEAHRKDMIHQGEHNCKCMTYWIDETRENVFCLIEAPDKAAVENMHREAHGLIPNKIIEVNSAVVESFLGRIYDPEEATVTNDGLKVFHDPSYRILLLTKLTDPLLLKQQLGAEKSSELLNRHNHIIRRNLFLHHGREAEYKGTDFIISFSSAAGAVACALAIQKEMQEILPGASSFTISVNAGEPLDKSNRFFGDAIRRGTNLCSIAKNNQVAVSSSVKELLTKDYFQNRKDPLLLLSTADEDILDRLFKVLEENWQQAEFDIADYCKVMAMSKSQLYRKSISLTGLSPNILLKEFRLEKAKELMSNRQYNIAQVTFDSGFTSASYFTKCFKKKFGLLPMAYTNLLA